MTPTGSLWIKGSLAFWVMQFRPRVQCRKRPPTVALKSSEHMQAGGQVRSAQGTEVPSYSIEYLPKSKLFPGPSPPSMKVPFIASRSAEWVLKPVRMIGKHRAEGLIAHYAARRSFSGQTQNKRSACPFHPCPVPGYVMC